MRLKDVPQSTQSTRLVAANPAKKGEMALRILLPLILIVLAARGTVTPHHLALEHSEVSNSKELNEMALNAVWCFDK